MMVFYTRFLSNTKRYMHNAVLACFVWILSFLCLYIVMCAMFIIPIALHEFGHYGACKSLGIGLKTCQVGIGPSFSLFQFKETDFRIGVLPLGGFYMPMTSDSFTGEHPSFRLAEDASAAENLWISSAGILANLLTSFLIYAFFYYRDIRYSKESNSAVFKKHYKSFCRVFCYVCLSIFSFGFLPKNKAAHRTFLFQSGALQTCAVLSMYLAICNMLPIAFLDGSKILHACSGMIGINFSLDRYVIQTSPILLLYVLAMMYPKK